MKRSGKPILNSLLRTLAPIGALATLSLGSLGAAASLAACSSDDTSGLLTTDGDSGTTARDASLSDTGTGRDSGTTLPGNDAAVPTADAAATPDAADAAAPPGPDAADATPPGFCATQAGLAFCADFDTPSVLSADGGISAWDSLRQNPSTEITQSSARAVSAPYSALFATVATDIEPGPAGFKTVTPAAGVSSAIYEFDIYVDKVPAGKGGFLTDFQFQDGDNFGYRMIVNADAAGALASATVEHNPGNTPSPLTGFTFGAWHHMKFALELSTLAADAGNNAHFTAFLDRAATPVIDTNSSAPFAKAAFARIAAGVVFSFDGAARGWGISYDNVTLKVQ